MSELDETLDSYSLSDKMPKFNGLRWAMDEAGIFKILNSVRASKASLNLILTVFTWWEPLQTLCYSRRTQLRKSA